MSNRPTSRPTHQVSLRVLLLLGAALAGMLSVQPWLSRRAAAQEEPAAPAALEPRIYLPLAAGGKGPGQPGDPGQPGNPGPVTRGAFFFNREAKNNSADVAIDAAGGMHAAYAYFTAHVEHPPAVYTYCPGPASACATPAGWSAVQLGDLANEVQLALTPAGQPRLLIVTSSTVFPGGKDYYYAACDAGCTSQAGWTLTLILSTDGTAIQDVNNDRLPQRSFALDPQGRPRFVYQDRNYLHAEPDHIGAYYAWCDEQCTDAANWFEVRIGRAIEEQFRRDYEIFDTPALAFTADGSPRLVARVFGFNEDGSAAPSGLYYFACDAACDTHEGWQRVFLLDTGGGSFPHPTWDLALTADGRPRIALFTGDGLQQDEIENRLLYLWCDEICLDQAGWFFNFVGLARGSGQSADLELDGAGRPRTAWITSLGDLGYAWCNTACETDQAQWQQQVVETEAMLKQEFPQAIPPHCDTDTWEGLAPALALDGQGSPRITYDVSVNARCYYDDTPGDPTDPPVIRFEPVWRGVHLNFFPQP
ncbi:MAG TPA: hypothetical protein VNL77_16755 [Roseiflexaceae bacterium]|nr:hypothetical protein [Roseiflexaceae bacterium]